MSRQVIRAADVAPQAWRNRSGQTRELLAWPGAADWKLRISVADIEADGPFSAFDGVQRWFAVISGAGVRLRFADAERSLRPGDAPLCFDGAAAPGCRLIDGPTRDLNLMARDGKVRARDARMQLVAANVPWHSSAQQRGLFCAVGGRCEGPSGERVWLPANTLLWHDEATPGPFHFTPDAPADGPLGWWLEYSPS